MALGSQQLLSLNHFLKFDRGSSRQHRCLPCRNASPSMLLRYTRQVMAFPAPIPSETAEMPCSASLTFLNSQRSVQRTKKLAPLRGVMGLGPAPSHRLLR